MTFKESLNKFITLDEKEKYKLVIEYYEVNKIRDSHIFYTKEINEILSDWTPFEIIHNVDYVRFNLSDTYTFIDDYSNLKSYETILELLINESMIYHFIDWFSEYESN